MYIHTVVEQGKGRVGVTQAVQRAVLVRTRACDQPCVCDELAEGLVDVLGYGAIGQSKHRQIDTLLEQVFKRDVRMSSAALVDALEVIDGPTATDDIPVAQFYLTRSSPRYCRSFSSNSVTCFHLRFSASVPCLMPVLAMINT